MKWNCGTVVQGKICCTKIPQQILEFCVMNRTFKIKIKVKILAEVLCHFIANIKKSCLEGWKACNSGECVIFDLVVRRRQRLLGPFRWNQLHFQLSRYGVPMRHKSMHPESVAVRQSPRLLRRIRWRLSKSFSIKLIWLAAYFFVYLFIYLKLYCIIV